MGSKVLIVNRWKDFVSDGTISLLSRWIEYYIYSQMHSAAKLPTEGRRHLFKKGYNRLEQVIYRIEILEGLETSRSTAPKQFTELDEFTFAFRSIEKIEQVAILAYVDPLDELKSEMDWKSFLYENAYRSNADFDRMLTKSMVDLQKSCERRKLSKIMKQEIKGWDKISSRLDMTIPTVIKLSKDPELQMPITMLGKIPITTEDKLSEWLNERIEKRPCWKVIQERSNK